MSIYFYYCCSSIILDESIVAFQKTTRHCCLMAFILRTVGSSAFANSVNQSEIYIKYLLVGFFFLSSKTKTNARKRIALFYSCTALRTHSINCVYIQRLPALMCLWSGMLSIYGLLFTLKHFLFKMVSCENAHICILLCRS